MDGNGAGRQGQANRFPLYLNKKGENQNRVLLQAPAVLGGTGERLSHCEPGFNEKTKQEKSTTNVEQPLLHVYFSMRDALPRYSEFGVLLRVLAEGWVSGRKRRILGVR